MNLDPYDIRPLLDKWELAIRFFPGSSKDSAVKRLNRRIAQNSSLLQALQAAGYKKGKKLTGAQIRLIVEALC